MFDIFQSDIGHSGRHAGRAGAPAGRCRAKCRAFGRGAPPPQGLALGAESGGRMPEPPKHCSRASADPAAALARGHCACTRRAGRCGWCRPAARPGIPQPQHALLAVPYMRMAMPTPGSCSLGAGQVGAEARHCAARGCGSVLACRLCGTAVRWLFGIFKTLLPGARPASSWWVRLSNQGFKARCGTAPCGAHSWRSAAHVRGRLGAVRGWTLHRSALP